VISLRRASGFAGPLFLGIRSIVLLTPVLLLLLALIFIAEAQSSGQPAFVGVLHPGRPPLGPLEAFRDGLRERNYMEGHNLKLEWRFADGQNARLPRLARELVDLKVDAIFAINTQAAQAAKSASRTIPIVIARVSDPVQSGLVASLGRPGGNVTGVSAMYLELSAKRLQLLKEALPKTRRVAVIWNSGNPGGAAVVRKLQAESSQFGLQLQVLQLGVAVICRRYSGLCSTTSSTLSSWWMTSC